MYYSMIGLLAVLVLLIVNQDILFSSKASFVRPAWNVYRRFLYAVLVYYITDILWGFLESRKLRTLLFIDTTAYFVAMSVGVLFWAGFAVTYLQTERSSGRLLLTAGRAIAGTTVLFTVVNIFVPVLFTVDEDSVYEPMPIRHVLLVAQILYLIVISVYAYARMLSLERGNRNRPRYRILGAFGMIMAIVLLAQLFFPYVPLYAMAYTLGTCMLHSFVANDEKEEYRAEIEEAEKVTELTRTITSLLNNMPGMTFTKDARTGAYLACNQAFAEYAHKDTPGGVVGLTDAQIFDKNTAERFVRDDKTALSMSTSYVFFEEVLDAEGRERQLQTTRMRYRDTSGRLCVLGICQDVTDMVRVQHENAMTKEAYESAVSTGRMYSHIAQTLARDYTDMYYVNCDTEEYVEYRRGNEGNILSEMGRGWHFFSDCREKMGEQVCPEDREAFLAAMSRKTLLRELEKQDTFTMTYRRTGADGPTYVSMKVSRNENDGRFLIFGVTNVDAKMRDAMSKSEALAAALSSARQANEAKSAFLSHVCHSIHTPVNAIIGLDALALKKGSIDDGTRRYVEQIGTNAEHLLSLSNDMLDFSRIEAGRLVLRREAFSLSAMLEKINAALEAWCGEKGLTYACRVPGRIDAWYIGDERRLTEVLLRVLSNAVRFTDAPGSVAMTVERASKREEETILRFCVRDTGIGMDKEFLPKLFEPFATADSRRAYQNGSTGMGMPITKGIVDLMNGSIEVRSEKGVGTVFDLRVTLQNCEDAEAAPDNMPDPRQLYALVADDNPVDAEYTRSVLEELGLQTELAAGTAEAVRMVEEHHARLRPYHLIFLAWEMPGMQRLEIPAKLQKQYGKESRVVILTSYNWEGLLEEGQSFLRKPLFAGNVLEELRRISRRGDLVLEKKRSNLAGCRVLLAEDTDINARNLQNSLAMMNIEVDRAVDGEMAVEMFKKSVVGAYAAILMDVRMPKMDGLKAAAVIREMDREDAKHIPIIAMTENAFDEDVQRSLKAGLNAQIGKPVDPDRLLRILSGLV